jgi:hypothetical protein
MSKQTTKGKKDPSPAPVEVPSTISPPPKSNAAPPLKRPQYNPYIPHEPSSSYHSLFRCLNVFFDGTPHTLHCYLCYLGITVYGGLLLSSIMSYAEAQRFLPMWYFTLACVMFTVSEFASLFLHVLLVHDSPALVRNLLRCEIAAASLLPAGLGVFFIAHDMSLATGWVQMVPELSWENEMLGWLGVVGVMIGVGMIKLWRWVPMALHWAVFVMYAVHMSHSASARHTPRFVQGILVHFIALFIRTLRIPETIIGATARYIGNSDQLFHLLMIVCGYLTVSEVFYYTLGFNHHER